MMPKFRPQLYLGVAVAALVTLPGLAAQAGSSMMGQARARKMAQLGRLPSPDEIVIDHIVNYHRHGIPLPRAGEDVAVDLRWDVPLPAYIGESVLQIGLATERLHDLEHARPMNIALVIDCSGSMQAEDKMSRVKQGMRKLVEGLRPADRVAIVTYADEGRVVMPSRRIESGREVMDAISRLDANGNTNLFGGLELGYAEVDRYFDSESTNRVILLTDGIANKGVIDPAQIVQKSQRYRGRVDLSTIGVGLDFNRELLGELAKSGRGLFQFVADEEDISNVFERELQSLIGGAAARNVRLEVTHGPDIVVERIYGYEPVRDRTGFKLQLEDFNVGMTNVVLVKFRRVSGFEGASRSADGRAEARRGIRGLQGVEVTLRFETPQGGQKLIVRDTEFLDPDRSGSRSRDHEVRKNFTIAVMARAIHDMAALAERKRYGDAARRVRLALDYVRLQYPSTKDADILRTKDMLTKYQKVLGARIERFRDL